MGWGTVRLILVVAAGVFAAAAHAQTPSPADRQTRAAARKGGQARAARRRIRPRRRSSSSSPRARRMPAARAVPSGSRRTAPSTPVPRPACARCWPARQAQAADLLPFAGRLGDRLDGNRPHDAGAEDQGRRRPHHPAGLRPQAAAREGVRRDHAVRPRARRGTAHARDLSFGLRLRPDRRGRAGGRAGRRARRAQRLDHAHVQAHEPRGQGSFCQQQEARRQRARGPRRARAPCALRVGDGDRPRADRCRRGDAV